MISSIAWQSLVSWVVGAYVGDLPACVFARLVRHFIHNSVARPFLPLDIHALVPSVPAPVILVSALAVDHAITKICVFRQGAFPGPHIGVHVFRLLKHPVKRMVVGRATVEVRIRALIKFTIAARHVCVAKGADTLVIYTVIRVPRIL